MGWGWTGSLGAVSPMAAAGSPDNTYWGAESAGVMGVADHAGGQAEILPFNQRRIARHAIGLGDLEPFAAGRPNPGI